MSKIIRPVLGKSKKNKRLAQLVNKNFIFYCTQDINISFMDWQLDQLNRANISKQIYTF